MGHPLPASYPPRAGELDVDWEETTFLSVCVCIYIYKKMFECMCVWLHVRAFEYVRARVFV